MFYQPYGHAGGQVSVVPMMIPQQHPARFLAQPRKMRTRQSYFRSDQRFEPSAHQQAEKPLAFRIDRKGRSKHHHRRAPVYNRSINEFPLPVRLTANGIVVPKSCWNCGEGHTINNCSFPRNNECVQLNRSWQNQLEAAKMNNKSLSTIRHLRNSRPKRKYSNKPRYFVESNNKTKKSASFHESSATETEMSSSDRRYVSEPVTPSTSQSSREDLERRGEEDGNVQSSRSRSRYDDADRGRGRWHEKGRQEQAREPEESNRKRYRERDADYRHPDDRKRRRIDPSSSHGGDRGRQTSERSYRQPRQRQPPPMSQSLPPRPHHNGYADHSRRAYDHHGHRRGDPHQYQTQHRTFYQQPARPDYGAESRSAPYLAHRARESEYGRRDRNYPPQSYPMGRHNPYPVHQRSSYSSRRYY